VHTSLPVLLRVFNAAIKRLRALYAAFFCLVVIAPKKHVCQTGNPIQITQSHGVLASLVAAETGCGSAHAPWHLRALPGQRINITLLDFSWATAANDVFFLPTSGRQASSSEAGLREVNGSIQLVAKSPDDVYPLSCA